MMGEAWSWLTTTPQGTLAMGIAGILAGLYLLYDAYRTWRARRETPADVARRLLEGA